MFTHTYIQIHIHTVPSRAHAAAQQRTHIHTCIHTYIHTYTHSAFARTCSTQPRHPRRTDSSETQTGSTKIHSRPRHFHPYSSHRRHVRSYGGLLREPPGQILTRFVFLVCFFASATLTTCQVQQKRGAIALLQCVSLLQSLCCSASPCCSRFVAVRLLVAVACS